jgi:hypothetical protein
VSMKNKFLRITLVALGIACCAIIISCVCQSPSPGGEDKVVFGEDSICIPGTAITKDDQKAMNDVLAQYRTSLYKIETYQDGARSQTRGTLPDETIGKAAVSQTRANAKLHHLNGSAIQVGFLIGTRHHVTPTPGAPIGTHHATPTPGAHIGTSHHVTPTPSDEDYEEAAALVKRLKPILKKYSRE